MHPPISSRRPLPVTPPQIRSMVRRNHWKLWAPHDCSFFSVRADLLGLFNAPPLQANAPNTTSPPVSDPFSFGHASTATPAQPPAVPSQNGASKNDFDDLLF